MNLTSKRSIDGKNLDLVGLGMSNPKTNKEKQKIIDILDECCIKQYKINDNGYVDVYGAVSIWERQLIDGKFPVKFGMLHGCFNCSCCYDLLTLEGAPELILEYFSCNSSPEIKSLDGIGIVKGNFTSDNFSQEDYDAYNLTHNQHLITKYWDKFL